MGQSNLKARVLELHLERAEQRRLRVHDQYANPHDHVLSALLAYPAGSRPGAAG